MNHRTVLRRAWPILAALTLTGTLVACGHRGTDPHGPSADDRPAGRAPHREDRAERGDPMAELLGWGPSRGRPPHGAALGSEDASRQREQITARLTRDLSLDTTQQARLSALADAIDRQRQQREASRPAAQATPAAQGPLHWIRGSTFDRAAAQAELDARLAAMKAQEPAVITAAADFYDSLKPAQQEQVRTALNRPHGRGEDRRAPR